MTSENNNTIITEFNNQGVTFIEKGSYSQALIMFQGAFRVLTSDVATTQNTTCCCISMSSSSEQPMQKMQLQNHPEIHAAATTMLMNRKGTQYDAKSSLSLSTNDHKQVQEFSTLQKSGNYHQHQHQHQHHHSLLTTRRRSHQYYKQQHQDNAPITMFTEPIKIYNNSNTSMNQDTNDFYNAYFCIVLYNRALATHLQALEIPPSSNQEARLLCAIQLYEMALDLIPEKNMEEMDMSSSCYITLATLNNMCLIHYSDLRDLDAALVHSYDLEATLEWLRDFAQSLGLQPMWRDAYINTMILFRSQFVASVAPMA